LERQFHDRFRGHGPQQAPDPDSLRPRSTLGDGVEQFPDSGKMMIVVFGDKIQMVYQPHRDF
jgi:hypothetical protein